MECQVSLPCSSVSHGLERGRRSAPILPAVPGLSYRRLQTSLPGSCRVGPDNSINVASLFFIHWSQRKFKWSKGRGGKVLLQSHPHRLPRYLSKRLGKEFLLWGAGCSELRGRCTSSFLRAQSLSFRSCRSACWLGVVAPVPTRSAVSS